jgi:hypothetical protein
MKMFLAVASLLLLPVLLEGAGYLSIRYIRGSSLPPQALFKPNFNKNPSLAPDCSWEQTIQPHPFMGYSYHLGLPCSRHDVNAYGLESEIDFPETKDPNWYSILALGSSLSEQMTHYSGKSSSELEDILNERFISPNGKPFRVLNGAIAGGAEPMSIGSLVLLADLVDAVISVEGHVELGTFGARTKLAARWPQNLWLPANGMSAYNLLQFLLLRKAKELEQFFGKNRVFHHSYFCFLLSSGLVDAFSNSQISQNQVVPPWASSHDEAELKGLFLREYSKYLRILRGICRENGLKLAIFLPPTPTLEKSLTAEERAVAGDMSWGVKYREMTDHLLLLRHEGIPIFSLLGIFKQFKQRVYLDDTHFLRNEEANGYIPFDNAIVKVLQGEWHLRPKEVSIGRKNRD